MRIDSSYIGMESARKYSSRTTKTQGFFMVNRESEGTLKNGSLGETFGQLMNAEEQEGENKKPGTSLEDLNYRYQSLNRVRRTSDRELSNELQKMKEKCVQYIFELLFARREKRKPNAELFEEEQTETLQNVQSTSGLAQMTNTVNVWSYGEQTYHYEEEATSFSTTGTVKTADGRTIEFNLDFSMSRTFERYYQETYDLRNIQFKDPLVINLEGNVTELSDQKFFFDLDADGEKECISKLADGNGYLALDKNGDGIINDGSELFGTRSGDGFADLLQYDEDKNGWIDENDSIWSKLQIWTQDEDGKDILYRLGEKGVGAICLQRASTDFTLMGNTSNNINGRIRSTGIFLYENGNVGTMQQLDLAQ